MGKHEKAFVDIFKSKEAAAILDKKYVLFIGDSVIRGMYKDLLRILQTDQLLSEEDLKRKGELTLLGDQLLAGGQMDEMNNSTNYTEVREYKTQNHIVRFYFITRCYSEYLKTICENIKNDIVKPDLVVMNSGCWDLTRYGRNSFRDYKKYLPIGIYNLCKVLPEQTVFLWTTTMPLSKVVKGGFMTDDCHDMMPHLREDVLEANHYAAHVMRDFKLDLLDLHYYFHKQTAKRNLDGIHWNASSHRRISNLILNHLCDSWDIETNGRTMIKNDNSLIDLGANIESDDEEEWFDNDYNTCYETDFNNNNNYDNGFINNRNNNQEIFYNQNIQRSFTNNLLDYNFFPIQNQDLRNKLSSNFNFNMNGNDTTGLFSGKFNQFNFNSINPAPLVQQPQFFSSALGPPSLMLNNNYNIKRPLNSSDSNSKFSIENGNQNKKRRIVHLNKFKKQ